MNEHVDPHGEIVQAQDVAIWDSIHRRREWGTCPHPVVARWAMRTWGATLNTPQSIVPLLLDIGCGVGPNAIWLAETGFVVDGMDASPHAIARANSGNPMPHSARFRVGTVPEALELAPGDHYHGAFDVCCLQHVSQLHRTLQTVHRVLKPGGSFLSLFAATEHAPLSEDHNHELARATFMRMSRAAAYELFAMFEGAPLKVDKLMRTDGDTLISHLIIQATK